MMAKSTTNFNTSVADREPLLFLVATPIGNLGDITARALETLGKVDYIASEDTRKSGIMLKHFGIKKPMISFYEHNEQKALPRIINLLQQGKSVALISNAGTPGISDPGYSLVQQAIQNDISLTMIPGATALAMAIVLSGLPSHSFTFRGFPPRRPGTRQRFLEVDRESPHTLIFYESPHRLVAFLQDALEVYGDRRAFIANDLTKKFETLLRGKLTDLISQLEGKELLGEYVVVIEGSQ